MSPRQYHKAGTVDNVPREALRVVLSLAAFEVERRNPEHHPGDILARALRQVRAAYDGERQANAS